MSVPADVKLVALTAATNTRDVQPSGEAESSDLAPSFDGLFAADGQTDEISVAKENVAFPELAADGEEDAAQGLPAAVADDGQSPRLNNGEVNADTVPVNGKALADVDSWDLMGNDLAPTVGEGAVERSDPPKQAERTGNLVITGSASAVVPGSLPKTADTRQGLIGENSRASIVSAKLASDTIVEPGLRRRDGSQMPVPAQIIKTLIPKGTSAQNKKMPNPPAVQPQPQPDAAVPKKFLGEIRPESATSGNAIERHEWKPHDSRGHQLVPEFVTLRTALDTHATFPTTLNDSLIEKPVVEPFPQIGVRPAAETLHVPSAPVTVQAAPTSAGHIAAQMAIAISQNNAVGTTEISLSPQELGRVRMVISVQDTVLTMTIYAERPEVSDLLRRNIDQLAEEFRSMGYEAMDFEFSEDAEGGENTEFEQSDAAYLSPGDSHEKPRSGGLVVMTDGLDIRI